MIADGLRAGVAITVIVENRGGDGCAGAHGFAAWVDAGGAIVLVDAGPDPALLAANAARLGLDLARVEAVVLSHGHDDHTGGLPAVVAARAGRPLRVVMHPAATRARFSRRTGAARAIGMPPAALAALGSPGVAVVATAGPTAVSGGVWATGAIPRRVPVGEAHLVLDPDGRVPDPLEDDQAVMVDTVHGLVVICGCAHAGVGNTLAYVASLRPGRPIALLLGGLHLAGASPAAIADAGEALDRHRVSRCAVGHCTGPAAEAALAGTRGGALRCGSRLTVPASMGRLHPAHGAADAGGRVPPPAG